MVIILALFILAAVLYTATHGMLAVTLIIASLGIPAMMMFTLIRANGKKKMPQRSTVKHWDHADGEPPEIIDHHKDK